MSFPDRRTFLQTTMSTGLVGIAGWFSSGTSRDDQNATNHETSEREGADTLEHWLATANDPYPPQVRDLRFDERPTVHVGLSNPKAFAPPAIMVTPGTAVTWKWVGEGGEHNVVATDGTFDSGEPVAEGGNFQHTFENEGTYRYVCEPHAEEGMKGVVVVKSAPRSGYPEVDEWLAGIDAYDGTVTNRTSADLVEITAGAEGNGGHFAFDPLAVKISTDTTVRWSWSGEGGAHTVSFEDAEFGHEEPEYESGIHFEHTFTETGIVRYNCGPHRSIGERGAIIVE